MLYVQLSPQDVLARVSPRSRIAPSSASSPTAMNPSSPLQRIFLFQMQTLAASLQPGTIRYYQSCLNRFLRYVSTAHPGLLHPQQLRRDPHILGWLRNLAEETPPLSRRTRRACLLCVRRLFEDLIANGHPLPHDLLLRQNFPPRDLYLPQALSPDNDALLDRQLRRTDALLANALLQLRGTGMRIGECRRLRTDCLRHLGDEQWAIHVPLGKLHTERWVPVDDDLRRIVARILSSRGGASHQPGASPDWLLTQPDGRKVTYHALHKFLQQASRLAGCSAPRRPHQLGHTYASSMLRASVSLPAVKESLGHKDIRMTMVYIQVTQTDLQQQDHLARGKIAATYALPHLSKSATVEAGIPAISRLPTTASHLLEMQRRQLADTHSQLKIRRLINRLTKVAGDLARFANAEK
jgi:site-specific recombinase XerD